MHKAGEAGSSRLFVANPTPNSHHHGPLTNNMSWDLYKRNARAFSGISRLAVLTGTFKQGFLFLGGLGLSREVLLIIAGSVWYQGSPTAFCGRLLPRRPCWCAIAAIEDEAATTRRCLSTEASVIFRLSNGRRVQAHCRRHNENASETSNSATTTLGQWRRDRRHR